MISTNDHCDQTRVLNALALFKLVYSMLVQVIDKFNRLKKEYDGSAFLTEQQRQWVATRKV